MARQRGVAGHPAPNSLLTAGDCAPTHRTQIVYKNRAAENLLAPQLWAMLPGACKRHAYWDDTSKKLIKIDAPVSCTGDGYPVSHKDDPCAGELKCLPLVSPSQNRVSLRHHSPLEP